MTTRLDTGYVFGDEISHAHVAFYQENGFLVAESLYSETEIQR